MENKIELIISIVNSGYSDKVMETVKNIGAKGGTIFEAIGSAGINAEKLYGITINPEKEIIMILVSSRITSNVLKKLYENTGPSTSSQGIAFSLPVNEATTNLFNQYKESH